jgi:dTDP-4-dehydrorhamnose reductase
VTRVLVTGATGQVGSAVASVLARDAALTVLTPPRTAFDLDQPASLERALDVLSPSLVVHCAAWTAVDHAEQEPEACARANTDAPQAIAGWCAAHGAAMLHVSTEYVFDGLRETPYLEDTPTSPVQVYGRTKRDGEAAVLSTLDAAAVVRVSGVHDATRRNFVTAILGAASAGKPLRVVADQITAPTSAALIADHLAAIAQAALRDARGPAQWLAERRGVYHASASGAVSWRDFAMALLARASMRDAALLDYPVAPITSDEYGAPARRPVRAILGGTRLEQVFGLTRRSWETHLDATIAGLAT